MVNGNESPLRAQRPRTFDVVAERHSNENVPSLLRYASRTGDREKEGPAGKGADWQARFTLGESNGDLY